MLIHPHLPNCPAVVLIRADDRLHSTKRLVVRRRRLALANIVVTAGALLLWPGTTTGMIVLSWLFGGLFVVCFLLARLRRALSKRDRLAAVPSGVGRPTAA